MRMGTVVHGAGEYWCGHAETSPLLSSQSFYCRGDRRPVTCFARLMSESWLEQNFPALEKIQEQSTLDHLPKQQGTSYNFQGPQVNCIKKLDPKDYRWRILEAIPCSSGDQTRLPQKTCGRTKMVTVILAKALFKRVILKTMTHTLRNQGDRQ